MDKKKALLKAAKELFGEFGYAETTFKKIAEKAQVALGLLSHHYGSKEKIFLAAGLDVLKNFHEHLENAILPAKSGYEGVLLFCKAYLDFSIKPGSNWLVLVRCSPYSDLKISANQEMMESRFAAIYVLLEKELLKGINDKSLVCANCKTTAQVIIAMLVGANRTYLLTPYASKTLYNDVLDFITRSISVKN